MYKKIVLTVIFLLLSPYEAPAKPGINPITSYNRIWLEWNLTPNVKWAPSSVDPEAIHDRTLNVLKLQPVFSARLNKDWTILTRTIFRFVSAPSASTEFGPSPLGEPFVPNWNQRNRTNLSDVSPTSFFVPNLGPNWTIGFGPSLVIPAGDGPNSVDAEGAETNRKIVRVRIVQSLLRRAEKTGWSLRTLRVRSWIASGSTKLGAHLTLGVKLHSSHILL